MDKSFGDEATIGPVGKSGGHTYALKPGDLFGQYRVIRVLGAGGMGEVYEVEHKVLRRRYAIKLLPETLDWKGVSVERFEREAQVMANLDHPNILKVDEFGETDGRYWLRMEVAEGLEGRGSGGEGEEGARDESRGRRIVSLQDLADSHGGKIPQEELLPILRQVLEGLQYAHSHGAIHRDLKPSNILLSEVGGSRVEAGGNTPRPSHIAPSSSPDPRPSPLAKISDFGLVRLVGEDWVRSQAQLSVQRSMSMGDEKTKPGAGESEGTSTRALLGTYEYMSPEQKRGEDADECSDLYAVGVMAYRLLTGRNIGPKLPSRIDKSLAEGWDDFVEQALEEDRDERLSSASSALSMLNTVGQELESAQQKAVEARKREEEARRRAEQVLLEEQRRKQAAEEERKRRQSEKLSRPAPPDPHPSRVPAKTGGGKAWLWLLLIVAGVVGYFLFTGTKEERETQARDTAPVSPPAVAPARPAQPTPRPSTRIPDLKSPWENSLGMKFNPVPGTDVLFGVWVTRVQDYQRFVDATRRSWSKPTFEQGPTHPAVNVSWDDAVAFCEWLTKVERDAGVIGPNQAYRLPRDWEWSVAVGLNEPRTGTPQSKHMKDDKSYPWNRGRGTWPPPSGAGNYGQSLNVDRFPNTSPVGSFDANAHGLYDLGGNVWEWCEDWYDESQRFTFGQRLDNLTLDSVMLVVKAIYSGSSGKKQCLKDLNLLLEQLRVLWRLVHDRRWISNQQLLFVNGKVDEIGRMAGGWLKQQEGRDA